MGTHRDEEVVVGPLLLAIVVACIFVFGENGGVVDSRRSWIRREMARGKLSVMT